MTVGDTLAQLIRRECPEPSPTCCLLGLQWGRIAHRLAQDAINVFGVDDWGAQRGLLQRAAVTPYDLLDDETCNEARAESSRVLGDACETVSARLWIHFPFNGPKEDLAPVDALFLNYDFSAHGVYALAMLWLPVLKPGGILCGSKYGDPRGGKGVRAGVAAISRRLGMRIHHEPCKLWWGRPLCPCPSSALAK